MILCFRIFAVLFTFHVKITETHNDCDQGNSTWTTEGVQGQVGRFPWLGIIRVHLHEGAKLRIAVTGAILVKDKYAIANADDVSKIPKRIFRGDSKAMFIPADSTPWTCTLKDFTAHPEYEYSSVNTIAIVELELEQNLIPVLPICWPEYLYNASNQLYALGYTDENELLEKVAYRVQYLEKSICEEFYNRAGLHDDRYVPTHYQCVFPENNTKHCEWDNGMVLAANASGTWVLIGLGIRGPGCSTPVRFIEMYQYLPWIEQVTDNQVPDYSLRKSKEKPKIQDIPVHNFFRDDDTEKGISVKETSETKVSDHKSIGWDAYDREHSQLYEIDRIDDDAIVISKFKNKYEKNKGDCLRKSKYLVYDESIKIIAYPAIRGKASYKLALMDFDVLEYNCITVRVISVNKSETYLYFKKTMEVDEPLDLPDRTPDFFMKKYPIPPLIPPTTPDPNITTTDTNWAPHPYLEPQFVTDIPGWLEGLPNVNLFLTISFSEEAVLKLEVWGTPKPPPTTTTVKTVRTRTSRTTTESSAKKEAAVREVLDDAEVARVVAVDRNFDLEVEQIGSGSLRAESLCGIVILFLILLLTKLR